MPLAPVDVGGISLMTDSVQNHVVLVTSCINFLIIGSGLHTLHLFTADADDLVKALHFAILV